MNDIDLIDLPADLLSEMNLNASKQKDLMIARYIEGNGPTSINQLLVHIYREKGEVMKRTRLVARLYRMVNRGQLIAHPHRKGVYIKKEPQ